MKKIGIVIEGGGFRGIYTAGILDYFLDENWNLPYVIGVSMGACNGANYVSRQRGRSLDVPYKFIDDPRYISFRNLVTKGSLFGMDFIFHEIPHKHNTFDFETFYDSNQEFVITAMNCHFGGAAYFKKDELNKDEFLLALKASCSLPFVSKMVEVKGRNYLDGGISDSIPVKKAFEDDIDKVIVLLTRPKGYRKERIKNNLVGHLAYRGYPEVIKAIEQRHVVYNETLVLIEKLEQEGKVLPIYPKEPIDMGRAERDKEKLKKVYLDGYELAKEMKEQIEKFISE